jgi:hypothetical protein
MKLQEKFKAVEMRTDGKSYSEILKSINVSKSTLSLWLRDIELTQDQKNKLLIGRKKSQHLAAKAKQQKRIRLTEQIVLESKKEVVKFIKNPLFLSGLMLYWAEGDKSEKTEAVKFSNSDARMVRIIMRWFREICKVPEQKFRVCIHMHALHCRGDIEEYWSDITGISLKQFYKTQIKPTSLKQRKNKLYDGTCAISVCNKNLFRKIKGWKIGFIEKM